MTKVYSEIPPLPGLDSRRSYVETNLYLKTLKSEADYKPESYLCAGNFFALEKFGSMIISLSMNITMNQLGGASVIAIFTTRRSHGYVNTTTWLGISQFFLFLAPNFNILTTENRSRCNRDLN